MNSDVASVNISTHEDKSGFLGINDETFGEQ
jgi:hypothetical protein